MADHWADKYAKQVIEKKEKDEYVVESGITPSGTVHAGNFREVMTQDLVYKALLSQGAKARYQYFWDDFDRFRKVPSGVSSEWEQHIGLPVTKTPDPWGCHDSYAAHFKEPFIAEAKACGVKADYVSATTLYEKCMFAENMKAALKNTSTIRDILNKFRREAYDDSWLPVRVYCEKCGKDTTTVTYPGEYELEYKCECGATGKFDFRKKRIAKMPWRICWASRWQHFDVDFESSGKDHHASGGSWDTSTRICEQVFNHDPPIGPMYEFINAKGQKEKMSSSVGNVFTVTDLLEVYEPEMVRYIYTAKVSKAIEVPFDLDLLNRYKYFDEAEKDFFEGKKTNEARCYELSAIGKPMKRVQPPFSFCVNIVQVIDDVKNAIEILQRTGHLPKKLSKQDEERVALRLKLAKNWVEKHAPENVKFQVKETVPDVELSDEQKHGLELYAKEFSEDNFNAACKKAGISAKDMFTAAYLVLLGKPRGPRLFAFIATLDEDFVRKRFKLEA